MFRASRGNFGLIWVRGKGRGVPHYAGWTRESARQWSTLAARLHDETGIDVQARQTGGFHLCFSEAELEARSERLAAIRDEVGTSGACVQALGISRLLIGPQIDPGVPWCHAASPLAPDGLHITLKSGNFGTPDFFCKALRVLA